MKNSKREVKMVRSEGEDSDFYHRIKDYPKEKRSKALLEQAEKLIKLSKARGDHDLLKAAETMITYWTLHSAVAEDKPKAHQLLKEVYNMLGESEKARQFGGAD